ncbi:MAG: hypothetical protein AAF366_10690 [Pseudomonadota bacterium]
MLHDLKAFPMVSPDVVDANDAVRRVLMAQGDDGLSVRRVDFGFRRARLLAARTDAFLTRMRGLGLTPLPGSETTGAEGDLILWIEASPHAVDFDLFDWMVTEAATECGWRCEGWSSFVCEGV